MFNNIKKYGKALEIFKSSLDKKQILTGKQSG